MISAAPADDAVVYRPDSASSAARTSPMKLCIAGVGSKQLTKTRTASKDSTQKRLDSHEKAAAARGHPLAYAVVGHYAVVAIPNPDASLIRSSGQRIVPSAPYSRGGSEVKCAVRGRITSASRSSLAPHATEAATISELAGERRDPERP